MSNTSVKIILGLGIFEQFFVAKFVLPNVDLENRQDCPAVCLPVSVLTRNKV